MQTQTQTITVMPEHLTFTVYCYVNSDGKHTDDCVQNFRCLRHKDAPLFPPGLGAEYLDTSDSSLDDCLLNDLDIHRELFFNPWDIEENTQDNLAPEPEPQHEISAPEYPRPSSFWDKPRPRVEPSGWFKLQIHLPKEEFPQFASSVPDPATKEEGKLASPSPEPPLLPALTPFGLGVVGARLNTAGLVRQKTIRPNGNPRAKSTMVDFLARYSPETYSMDPKEVQAGLLHPESRF